MINLSILEFGSIIINFFLTIVIGVSVNNILENKSSTSNSSIATTTTTTENPNPDFNNTYDSNMIYLIIFCCSLFSDIPFLAIVFMRMKYDIPSQMFIHFFTNVFKFIYWCIFITNNFTCKYEYIIQIFILFVAFGTILGAIIDLFFRKINYCSNQINDDDNNINDNNQNKNNQNNQNNENNENNENNQNNENNENNQNNEVDYRQEYLEGYQTLNNNNNINEIENININNENIENHPLLKYIKNKYSSGIYSV